MPKWTASWADSRARQSAIKSALVAQNMAQFHSVFTFSPDLFYHDLLQGVSRAGKQQGMADSRTALATHMWRLVDDCGANLGPVL